MTKLILACIFSLLIFTDVATAESVIASRTIRSNAVITIADLKLIEDSTPNTFSTLEQVVGMEARVVLFAGHPIQFDSIGPPALIDRNQIVPLVYFQEGLTIMTEGRALGRGGVGDIVRIMNLSSRNTISGVVHSDGTVRAGSSTFSNIQR